MRAVVQDRYGTDGVWRTAAEPVPVPGPGRVLVRVEAAGMDRGTWHLMAGLPLIMRPFTGLRRPRARIPGRDVAGRVVATGPGVRRFAVGDAVVGIGPGSFAEYTVAREDRLAHRPDGLTPERAAALPISGGTAWQAVHAAGRTAPGARVLVLGASGGVGTYTVQIARAAGAEVTAVCRGEAVEQMRSLGAAHVVDRNREDVADRGERFDVVIEIGGCASLRRLRGLATPRGTVVLVGSERPDARWTGGFGRPMRAAALSPFLAQRLVMLAARENHEDVANVVDLTARGEIVPVLDRVVGPEDAAAAMSDLGAGRVRGKIVVRMAGETVDEAQRTPEEHAARP